MDYALGAWLTLSFGGAAAETEPALAQAHERPATDHQVIEQLDVEQLARFSRRDRQADVFRRRRRITARVIVNQNHRGGVLTNRLTVNLANPYRGAIQTSSDDLFVVDHPVLGVQQDHLEV